MQLKSFVLRHLPEILLVSVIVIKIACYFSYPFIDIDGLCGDV
jgi:hypothetical protein